MLCFSTATFKIDRVNCIYLNVICFYFLKNGDLDEARRVGMEALQTIDATLITDRSAIWMALLDLENLHGNKVHAYILEYYMNNLTIII